MPRLMSSYTVLITRWRDYPFVLDPDAGDYPKISRSELNAVVQDDDSLEYSVEADQESDWFYVGIPTPDQLAKTETPCRVRVVTCSDPEFHLGYNEATGSIVVRNASPSVIEKLLLLSVSLNAVVRGYDGEIYTSGTEWEFHPDAEWEWEDADERQPYSSFLSSLIIWCLAASTLLGVFIHGHVTGSTWMSSGLAGAGVGLLSAFVVVFLKVVIVTWCDGRARRAQKSRR